MIDRKKLEAALEHYRNRPNPEWGDPHFSAVHEAAEALLEFLPKPRWKLRATFDGAVLNVEELDSMEEATRAMAGFLARGAIRVEIEAL